MTPPDLQHRTDGMVDSSFGKMLSQFVVPILLVLVSAFGGMVLNDIRVSVHDLQQNSSVSEKQMWAGQAKLANSIADIATKTAVLNDQVAMNREHADEAYQRMAKAIDKLTHRVDTIQHVSNP